MIKDESNIFRLIEVTTEIRTENFCNNALRMVAVSRPFLYSNLDQPKKY